MTTPPLDADARLRRGLESGRVHSAYLLSGPGEAPRDGARWFARALVCRSEPSQRPCEACPDCRRSGPREEEIALDGSGRKGPLLRHVGDHPDLLWVERGAEDTRVRIGQVRAVQAALRLQASEGGRRAAVFADADWLNQEAQNALLRLLEEPPPLTTLLLVTRSPASLLPTVRSRCQRIPFPADVDRLQLGADAPPEVRETVERLEGLARDGLPELLDWAEEFRGPRATAAVAVQSLLATASAWLHQRATDAVLREQASPEASLRAFRTLQLCRKGLAQRNANPQMVAERALLALRDAQGRPG